MCHPLAAQAYLSVSRFLHFIAQNQPRGTLYFVSHRGTTFGLSQRPSGRVSLRCESCCARALFRITRCLDRLVDIPPEPLQFAVTVRFIRPRLLSEAHVGAVRAYKGQSRRLADVHQSHVSDGHRRLSTHVDPLRHNTYGQLASARVCRMPMGSIGSSYVHVPSGQHRGLGCRRGAASRGQTVGGGGVVRSVVPSCSVRLHRWL